MPWLRGGASPPRRCGKYCWLHAAAFPEAGWNVQENGRNFKNHPISSFPGKLSRRILRKWVPTLCLLISEKNFPSWPLPLHSPLDEEYNLYHPTYFENKVCLSPSTGHLVRGFPYFDQHVEQKGVKKSHMQINMFLMIPHIASIFQTALTVHSNLVTNCSCFTKHLLTETVLPHLTKRSDLHYGVSIIVFLVSCMADPL